MGKALTTALYIKQFAARSYWLNQQWHAGKPAIKKKKSGYIEYANFCGVNTPTIFYFTLSKV